MNIAPPPLTRRTSSTLLARIASSLTSFLTDWKRPRTTHERSQPQTRIVGGRSPRPTRSVSTSSRAMFIRGGRGVPGIRRQSAPFQRA